jgi:hypothetical protein
MKEIQIEPGLKVLVSNGISNTLLVLKSED